MDLQRAFDEANKRLRTLNDQICCLTDAVAGGTYNNLIPRPIPSGNSYTFLAGTVHSIAWELSSGASVTITSGPESADFTNPGSIEFSTLNNQDITFTAVAGGVRVISIN